MSSPQPGWYPNPDGSADLRYWDGGAWSEQVRAAPPGVFPGQQHEETVSFPPQDPEAAGTPVNETIQFTDPPPADTTGHETMQFPDAPPAAEHATTDTTIFPGAGPVTPPPPPPPAPLPAPGATFPSAPAVPPAPAVPADQAVPPPPGMASGPASYTDGATSYGAPAPSYYPPAATQPVVSSSASGTGIAALVLGILGLVMSFLCGFLGLPLAVAAGVFGFVSISQANKMSPPGSKGMAIAGVVLAAVAVVISIGWVLLIFLGTAASSTSGGL